MDEAEKRKLDSGTTPGFKMDLGKRRFGLIPAIPMRYVADVYTMGAKKYSDHNWRLGMKWSRVIDAIHRHLNAFENGEDIDPESGLPHMAHITFGTLTLLEYMKTHPELDDRVKDGVVPTEVKQ